MENPATLAFFAVPSVTTLRISSRMAAEVSGEIVVRTTVGSWRSSVTPFSSTTSETM